MNETPRNDINLPERFLDGTPISDETQLTQVFGDKFVDIFETLDVKTVGELNRKTNSEIGMANVKRMDTFLERQGYV